MEIRRLETAKKTTTSKYLKSDYDKAIKRMRKILKIYDFNQRRKRDMSGCTPHSEDEETVVMNDPQDYADYLAEYGEDNE